MQKSSCLKPAPSKAQQGFSLVELITVIVLLGIVAIVAVPRFIGTAGFSEYAAQKRMISTLRNIQLKAMNDTRGTFCYRVIFDTNDRTGQFGPSSASYLPGQEAASCSSSIDTASDDFLRLDTSEGSEKGMTFTVLDAAARIRYIDFDSMGRPKTNASNCASGCTINILGEESTNVCVGSEGYIHAC